MLAELCFHGYEVPSPCLQARSNACVSFFAFKKWQFDWMRCLLVNGDNLQDSKDRARAKLLPLFLALNRSLKMVSYFLLNHEANWDLVREALTYKPADLEHICQVLSANKTTTGVNAFSTASLFDELPYTGYEGEHDIVQATIKRMMTYLQTFMQQEHRTRSYKGNVRFFHLSQPNCRCRSNEEMLDKVVQLSLNDAYVSEHACARLCSQEKR